MHKWGLSGTPPLDSAAAVAEIAGLLGYASADKSEEADVISQALHWGSFSARGDFPFSCPDMQQKLQTASEKFVAGFIRRVRVKCLIWINVRDPFKGDIGPIYGYY